MEESSPSQASATPLNLPKRAIDDDHTPAISSPLNPDFANSRGRKGPPAREQREKKESLKKREAKGIDNARLATTDGQAGGKKVKTAPESSSGSLALIRYKLPPPHLTDFDPPRPPVLVPSSYKSGRQFYETSEHVFNRKGFRYTHCIADPAFTFSQFHRSSETEPFTARFDYEDSSSHILFDHKGKSVSTEKGFRMARANVGAREGKWYWECKILSGVKPPNTEADLDGEAGGHVRIGFSRREASLDTPVGFDAYSYGLRDLAGQKVHMSRPKDFLPAGESFCEGDVIGLELHLPSLALHRKVVDGSYNKAVDVFDHMEPRGPDALDIIRDRLPIRYKSHLYFEQYEYHSSKDLEDLMNPSPVVTAASATSHSAPNPNHPLVPLRTLPFSCIKVYKNGRYAGTPFADLLAFLPPASRPTSQLGARDGLDDGTLAYYPSISVFHGGAVEANFGPDFWFPPPHLARAAGEDVVMADEDAAAAADTTIAATTTPTAQTESSGSQTNVQAMVYRYIEQIAEDVVYDLVDEVDLWALDGGKMDSVMSVGGLTAAGLGPVDSAVLVAGAVVAEQVSGVASAQTGEIKELVQEEE